jgi:hypothetical protein
MRVHLGICELILTGCSTRPMAQAMDFNELISRLALALGIGWQAREERPGVEPLASGRLQYPVF